MNKLFAELKRRNVFRVAGVYAVVGWVLAQIATTLEEAIGLPAWFDGLVVAFLLLGLPITIVIAWAFELTPQGVVRTEDVPLDASITADTGRKLDVAIVVGIVALVGMTIWQGLREAPVAPAPAVVTQEQVTEVSSASIAVLPFADLSPDGDQEYFSDGIAEEILNVLVGVDGLDVTSRTSSFQFKNVDLGIPEIANELKVRHVVEGSVRKSGNTIRVTAQLIDSTDDRHLWSDTYDRPLTTENIFEIQDDIANSIVGALSDALGISTIAAVHVEAATRDLGAYELYLRAMPMFHDRLDLGVADELLARAIELDPEFAQAWETRAALQVLARDYGYVDTTLEDAQRTATEFANRALQLDPDSATALALLANIKTQDARSLRARHDIAEILLSYERALGIEPRNASALNWRGLTLMHVGHLRAALQDFQTCAKYEPYYRPCVENVYTVLGNLGRDDASNAAFLQAMDRSTAKVEFAYLPSLARTGEELAFKMATNGPFMLQGWRRHDELWGAYLDPAGDHSELIGSIERRLADAGGHMDLTEYIIHPIGTGWRVPDVLVMWDPMMHGYRQSREFKSFIRESGALDYWREAGFPPQCRPLSGDDFECD